MKKIIYPEKKDWMEITPASRPSANYLHDLQEARALIPHIKSIANSPSSE